MPSEMVLARKYPVYGFDAEYLVSATIYERLSNVNERNSAGHPPAKASPSDLDDEVNPESEGAGYGASWAVEFELCGVFTPLHEWAGAEGASLARHGSLATMVTASAM